MEAEDLVFDFCCDWQALEDVSEHFPDEIRPIFLETLIVEAVEFVDFPVFMVSTKDSDTTAMLDLEKEDVKEGFNTIEAAVDIVAHEKVVGVG